MPSKKETEVKEARQLSFLQAQRAGQRLSVEDVMNKIQSTLSNGDPGDLTKVRTQLRSLKQCFSLVVDADQNIGMLLEDDGELKEEITEAQQFSLQVTNLISQADVFIEDNTATAPTAAVLNTTVSDSGSTTAKPKLPQLRITPFSNSYPLKWQEFWDAFESTVHNADLNSTDKFKYLKEFLKGNALLLAEGYRMTAANYDTVVEQLKQRYGDKEMAIQAHFDALLTLRPASGDINDLQRVYDECEVHIRSLVALDLDEDTFGRVFAPILKSKVPEHIRLELERRHDGGPWTLTNLRQLLRSEIHARRMSKQTLGATSSKANSENGSSKPKGGYQGTLNKGKSGTNGTASALIADGQSTNKPGIPCAFCNTQGHWPDDCPTHTDLESRKGAIKWNCFVCLRPKHKAVDCRSKRPCYYCKEYGKHHRSLCPRKFGKGDRDQSLNVNAQEFVPHAQSLVSATVEKRGRRGLAVMQTALAVVKGSVKSEKVRLLFDTASNRSFARTDLLKRLGVKSLGVETLAVAGLGSEKRVKKHYESAELDLILADGTVYALQVNGISSISSKVQKQAIDLKKFRVLAGLELADPIVDRPELVQVDVLIGLDNYYSLVGTEQCRIENLAVIDTKVGLIVSGCISQESAVRTSPSQDTVLMASIMTPEQEMHEMVENLWRMESIGICDLEAESDDQLAQRMFDESVSFSAESKRYEVRWPYKPEHPPLPTNYGLAYGRFKSLVRRLQRDPELFEKYNKIIMDQISRGVVEEAPSTPEGEVYYIPHQPEFKPTSATTKIRVVYDATAKVHKDVPSLNECLIRGPVYLADLCGLLMRFRRHRIGIVSDIEKAFHQVGLPLSERDVTRFLWLKDINRGFSNSNVKVLRYSRVLFGLICSPFLLAAVIRHHLSKVGSKVSRQILDNNYVDNVITGCSSLDEAKEYYKEAKGMFSEASMNLREWYSNSAEFLEVVAESDRGCTSKATKVLGLSWDLEGDQMNCILGSKYVYPDGPVTKRIVLRVTASLFDPCGYFAPITVRGKLLLQQLWQLECKWDEDVPDAQQREWKLFYDDFRQIPDVKLQRYQGPTNGEYCELHVFCDAAMSAYGAVGYLRTGLEGAVTSDLVFAKSRISPSKNHTQNDPVEKRLTVAKLELTAIVVGSKMASFVGNQLGISAKNIYVWSDSQCSLQQVMGDAKKPVFVRNRVQQVKANGEFALGYVPTEENPADLLTRDQVTVPILRHSSLWWNGPAWLTKEAEARPAMPKTKSKDVEYVETLLTEAAELEETQVLLVSATDLYPIELFSSWKHLLRITALALRFLDNIRAKKMGRPRTTGPLQADEVMRAKERWIKNAQQSFRLLLDKNPTAQTVRQLGLTLDGDGFVRCTGRLDHSELPQSAKYPLALPKDSPINQLLIDDVHRRLMHAGPTHMLAELRQEFWIVSARQQVRQVRKRCQICRIAKGGPFKTPTSAPLPCFRSSRAQSFSTVGIDYMGPLFIKSADGKVKCWICLFTCAVSRAIHLEVITDMTTEQFLLALRRFVAVYGKPDMIVCDNAKTFLAAKPVVYRLFRDAVNSEAVQGYSSDHGIEWKFVVELAPWMGGFYERMVGLVKDRLRCVLQKRLLSLVELQTVGAEVTSILNSRPLTYCEDEVGATVLTPKDLITHTRAGFAMAPPAEAYSDSSYGESGGKVQTNLVAKWKRIQSIVDQFWDTWQRQYLVALRERYWRPGNRGTSDMDAKVGSVVLIKEVNVPRGRWRIGRIISLETSFDGVQRSARVLLPDKSVFRRPLKLLCPVEVPEQDESSQGEEDMEAPQPTTTQTQPQPPGRPKRAAAVKAKRQLDQLREEDSGSEDF